MFNCGPTGPTNILPTVVHPTKCCVNHTFQNNIVPHVHPMHTTTVNHINYQHQHSFPQTQSVVNEVTHQHFAAGGGPVPGPGFGPGVAGAGFGPMGGPGMGGPGFGPMGGPGYGGYPVR